MIVYLLLCGFLYVFQESLIFFPQKLEKHNQFDFDQPFEEIYVQTEDDLLLHSLLFKVNNPRGVIFYLHGNAGSLLNWSSVAKTYNDLYYDVYLLDYRGYGKSAGAISGEEEFYRDIQTAYDTLRNKYQEDKIVVLGYSIGTGPATKLAADNRPALLILQAPYYCLTNLMRNTYPFIPTVLLKYKFPTYQFIQEVDLPIVVFHGTHDDVIHHASSLKLKEENQNIKVILLEGQGHNGITQNTVYQEELKKILP